MSIIQNATTFKYIHSATVCLIFNDISAIFSIL